MCIQINGDVRYTILVVALSLPLGVASRLPIGMHAIRTAMSPRERLEVELYDYDTNVVCPSYKLACLDTKC